MSVAITAVAVLLFVGFFTKVEAATFDLTADGLATFYFSQIVDPDGPNGPPISFSMFYNGAEYPQASSNFSSQVPITWIPSFMGGAVSTTTVSFTIDLETYPASIYGDGEYSFRLLAPNATETWVGFYRDGGSWDPVRSDSPYFSSQYNTRFTDLVFYTSTSSGSTSLFFTPTYFIDLEEVDQNDPKFNPSQVTVGIARQPETQPTTIGNSILPLTQTGSTTIEFEDLEDGVYDFLVKFWNLSASFDSAKQPFDKSYIYGQLTISGGSIVASQVDEFYDGTQPVPVSKQPCGVTAIDGCIYNAMVSLFVPSQDSVQSILNVSQTLEGKFPFAYAYDFYEVSANLYNSSTTQNLGLTLPFGDLGSTTIISTAQLEAVPFASSLRAIIAGLIWAMFAFLVYRRTLVIFNKA